MRVQEQNKKYLCIKGNAVTTRFIDCLELSVARTIALDLLLELGITKTVKMKIILLIAAMLGAVLAEDIEYYTTADDFLDMNLVLEDPEWTQSFVDCFLGEKPCDPVAASYLLVLADSIEHGCFKCNNAQKHLAHTFIDGLRTKMPLQYEKFANKFDPEGIWMDIFLEKTKGF